MTILNTFHQYLESQPKGTSPVTVKNYISDIRHFINWYETSFHKEFEPQDLDPEIVTLYRKTHGAVIEDNQVMNNGLSAKSLKRHLSTLRRFSSFLMEHKLRSTPLLSVNQTTLPPDIWEVAGFRSNLEENNSSYLTIKNYINDIQHFTILVLKHRLFD